jgi:hypothetical protein
VFYNLRDQVGTARAVSSRISKTRDDALEALRWLAGTKKGRTLPRFPVIGVALLLALLSIFVAIYYLNRRPVKRGRATDVWFYNEMNDILARKGIKRTPSVTPAEFALRLSAEKKGVYEGVLYITNIYNNVRFGGHKVGEDELSFIKEALERLKKS